MPSIALSTTTTCRSNPQKSPHGRRSTDRHLRHPQSVLLHPRCPHCQLLRRRLQAPNHQFVFLPCLPHLCWQGSAVENCDRKTSNSLYSVTTAIVPFINYWSSHDIRSFTRARVLVDEFAGGPPERMKATSPMCNYNCIILRSVVCV